MKAKIKQKLQNKAFSVIKKTTRKLYNIHYYSRKILNIIVQEFNLLQSIKCGSQADITDDIVNLIPVHKSYTNNFCIFSVGSCGSIWLAGLIHSHPEISCSAGFDHTIQSTYFNYNYHEFEKNIVRTLEPEFIRYGAHKYQPNHLAEYITAENYKEYMLPASYAAEEVIKAYAHKNNIFHEIPDRIEKSNLNELFIEMKDFYPNKKFCGNIHGMYCSAYYNLNTESKHNTIFADFIRHPVTRLEAWVNATEKTAEHDNVLTKTINDFIDSNAELVKSLQKEFALDFSDSNVRTRFFSNYGAIGKGFTKLCADDIKSLKVNRILFEQLKTDPSYLRWLISYLTGGYIVVSNDYLDYVYNDLSETSRISGKTKKFARAKDQWDAWPDWQKYIFKKHCNELNLKGLYSEFGYDLSFI